MKQPMRKVVKRLVCLMVVVLFGLVAMETTGAAKKSLFDKTLKKLSKCEKSGVKVLHKCDKMTPGDKQDACFQKAQAKYDKCIAKIQKGLDKKNKKALANRRKALKRCYKKNAKCIKKCRNDQRCAKNCIDDTGDLCVEKIDEKYPLNSMPSTDD